jgi:hypothetical protein
VAASNEGRVNGNSQDSEGHLIFHAATMISRKATGRARVQIPPLRLVLLIAFSLGVAGSMTDVSAQTFPDRPLRFIVPFPAGGATDAVARAMQPALEKLLGQSVVVENRSGAGSVLGVDAIAKSVPDGLTIGISGGGGLGVHIGNDPQCKTCAFGPFETWSFATATQEVGRRATASSVGIRARGAFGIVLRPA